MDICSIKHRGLKRFIEHNDMREIKPELVPRIRRIITALSLAADVLNVLGPPGWKIHPLTGERSGTWSIRVSGNWRITFRVEKDNILDLNLEDYH